MSESAFSHDIRLLVCGHCGAPLRAPGTGGHATCTYCDAVTEVAARDESPIVALGSKSAEHQALSITERMAELRKQDGKALRPPGTLPMALMVWHGEDDDKKYETATATWQAARERLAASSPEDNDESHLYFLTLALSNYYTEAEEPERQRALLETAVELVTTPRHRQVLRCMMARCAIREGDLEAAEAWLAPCDPESLDLHMDSAYRVTRAFMATHREDWQATLDLLGRDNEEVPVADFFDHLATLYRAHAFEMSSDLQSATSTLSKAMKRLPGTPRTFIEIAKVADIDLCPNSLPAAYAPIINRWKVRHAIFLTLWVAAITWVATDWMMDLGSLALGVGHWWPLIPLLTVGWIINVRWRP